MATKVMSLATAAIATVVYQWSLLRSNDALFWFANNNLFLNLAFVIASYWLVYLSFTSSFKTTLGYLVTLTASLSIVGAGAAGLFLPVLARQAFGHSRHAGLLVIA